MRRGNVKYLATKKRSKYFKKYRIKEKIKKYLVKYREVQQGYIIETKTNRLLKFEKVKEEKYYY